jgi:hypothetical protein
MALREMRLHGKAIATANGRKLTRILRIATVPVAAGCVSRPALSKRKTGMCWARRPTRRSRRPRSPQDQILEHSRHFAFIRSGMLKFSIFPDWLTQVVDFHDIFTYFLYVLWARLAKPQREKNDVAPKAGMRSMISVVWSLAVRRLYGGGVGCPRFSLSVIRSSL